jgi:hypothetical protein
VQIDACELFQLLSDTRDQLQSDANRSICKRDISEGLTLIGGMDALDSFKRMLESRLQVIVRQGQIHPMPVFLRRGGEKRQRKVS